MKAWEIFIIIRSLVIIIFIFPLGSICLGHSFDGPGGHAYDFRHVLEGCYGDNLDSLYKKISNGIDVDFYREVHEKFGKISGNHRIIGHWGFEGAIPFNVEPWKSQLAKIPKEELVEMWRRFTNSLVKYAVEKQVCRNVKRED